MNFLGHYYFARGVDDPVFVVGAALPDLLTQVDRRARIHLSPALPTAATLAADPLAAGAAHHLLLDRVWHVSAWFGAGAALARPPLRGIVWEDPSLLVATIPPARPPRLFFAGHIAVELVLDFLLEEAHPGTIDRYYAYYDRLDLDEIARRAVALLPQPPVRADDFAARFADHLRAFVASRYLERYRTVDGLAEGFWRVMRRARQLRHDGGRPAHLAEALGAIADVLRPGLAELQRELAPITVAAPPR